MKRILVAFVLFALTTGTAFAQGSALPYPNPENLSQEVANLVVEKMGDDEYAVRVFDNDRMYVVSYMVFRSGKKILSFDFYLSSRNFNDGARDLLAQEMIYGRPQIVQELHVSDSGLDGLVNVYQLFHKFNGGAWEGFTREERDMGKKAGVKQELYMDGKYYQRRKFWRDKWVEVSPEDKAEMQHDYEERLQEIKELLLKK